MAAPTKGFSVSALPNAPRIPGNIGVVDVKEIYEGVKRGLDAFETARRAPASMLLADAQLEAATQQAPLQTRGLLAETQAKEAQLPIRTALLAAEASPEMLEAKRQALLARSVKTPSGDLQLARALADAELRVAEDPNDAAAAQLVAVLRPMAMKKSAASMADPKAAIDQRAAAVADTNATRLVLGAEGNATKEAIAAANLEAAEKRAAAQNALRAQLHAEGLSQSEINARIAANSRVEAAKAANVNKAYQAAAEQNQQLHTALSSLALLENKADQYLASSLGSGPVVGSTPGLFVRAIFGDTAGQELKAAIGQEMTNAVKTVQGLGAMSNIEFNAVMEQLPRTTDQGPAMVTKLEFLKAIRPWLAARSDLYLNELEKGTSPVAAYQKVRAAFPVPPVPGAAALSPAVTPLPAAPSMVTAPPAAPVAPAAGRSFGSVAEAEAAFSRGELQVGDKITIGGVPGTWK